MILAGFSCCWASICGIQCFLNAALISDCSCDQWRRLFVSFCCATVPCPKCSGVRLHDCRILVRSSIDQLAWESYDKCVVLCQESSTNVEVHHSYHTQVSSILQQNMVYDLLSVAHNITIHIIRLSLKIDCSENPTFIGYHLAIRHPGLVETRESVCFNLKYP